MIDANKIVSDALDTASTSLVADRILKVKLRDALLIQRAEVTSRVQDVLADIAQIDADILAIAAVRKP